LVAVIAGALMVSPFSYNSFKEISVNGRISFTYALALPLIFIMVAVNPPLVLCALAVVYAVSGPVSSFLERRRQQLAGSDAALSGSTEPKDI
jgi:CDP-diacylglycerol--serine O-phosphatidyltransferase